MNEPLNEPVKDALRLMPYGRVLPFVPFAPLDVGVGFTGLSATSASVEVDAETEV